MALPPRSIVALLPALLLGFTSESVAAETAKPQPSQMRPQELIVDDNGIIGRLEIIGGGLVREAKAPRLRTLRQQLPRRGKCSLSLPVAEAPPAMSPDALYAKRSSGVLIVGMIAKRKKSPNYQVAGCSGFALTEDGVFVTNYHVVDDPEAEGIVIMDKGGMVWPATEILAADKLADVAILRAKGATFQPLPLATSDSLPGAQVWAISHPEHNFFSLTAGMVSRYFMATTELGRTPQMAITADFGVGSSGGPILNDRGEVTGMVCSTTSVYYSDLKAKISDLQMVLKHCVPVASIQALIEKPAE
jgi:S1-C subfamily serine protease